MHFFSRLNQSAYYWWFILVGGVALELSALFFQHVLGYEPCVLCIQIRIWLIAFIFVGLLGIFVYKNTMARIVLNGLTLVASIGFLERAWKVFATEKGWLTDVSCGMNAGLPSWLPLESLLPALFEVRAGCGFTPYIIFKISMADMLIVVAALSLVVTALMTIASVLDAKKARA